MGNFSGELAHPDNSHLRTCPPGEMRSENLPTPKIVHGNLPTRQNLSSAIDCIEPAHSSEYTKGNRQKVIHHNEMCQSHILAARANAKRDHVQMRSSIWRIMRSKRPKNPELKQDAMPRKRQIIAHLSQHLAAQKIAAAASYSALKRASTPANLAMAVSAFRARNASRTRAAAPDFGAARRSLDARLRADCHAQIQRPQSAERIMDGAAIRSRSGSQSGR